MNCPRCGCTNTEQSANCFRCGEPLRCPNCGKPIDPSPIVSPLGNMCSGCGNRLERIPSTGNQSGCLRVLAFIVMGSLATIFALAGSCFLLFSQANEFNGGGVTFVLIGIGCLTFAALCIWGIVWLSRRK